MAQIYRKTGRGETAKMARFKAVYDGTLGKV
jgi:hypothetical protein